MSRQDKIEAAILNAIEWWAPFYSVTWLKSWYEGRALENRKTLPRQFHERIIKEWRRL